MIQTTNHKLTEFLNLNKGPTLVYGESATGKTCLSLMVAIETAKKGKVIFIDTEGGFSTQRISQIFPQYQKILKNIFFIRADSFKKQHKIIKNLKSINNVDLIVIDTIGVFFRILVRNHKEIAKACLRKQLSILKQKTTKGTAVFITTQVYTDIEKNKIEPIGGALLKSSCSKIIRLDQDKNRRIPIRTINIEKPHQSIANFEIKNEGIVLT